MGPVSALEITILIESRQLAPNTLVWHEGLIDWCRASELDELRNRSNDDLAEHAALPTARNGGSPTASVWARSTPKVSGAMRGELVGTEYHYDKNKLLRVLFGAIAFVILIAAMASMPGKAGDDHPSLYIELLGGLFFAVIAATALLKLFNRNPGLTISRRGIHLPSYGPKPISWPAIRNLQRVQTRHIDSINFELDPIIADATRRPDFRGLLYSVLHGSKAKASINMKALRGDPDLIYQQCSGLWEKAKEDTSQTLSETGSTRGLDGDEGEDPDILVGRQTFTYILIAILAIVYAAELAFSMDMSKAGSLSTEALFVLGGTFQRSMVEYHQWWRLFTAPFMHGGPLHIGFNCLSLWFAGKLLERLIGWRWFSAIFFASALGGSAASVWINPANVVGVGASGGIVGLFVATIVISFRSSFSHIALALRMGAGQLLLPALMPFVSAAKNGENIDYAAHFGGAAAGGILALMLFVSWPRERPAPRFGWAAAMFTFFFVAIAIGSLWPISRIYETWIGDPMADYFADRYESAAKGFTAKAQETGTNAAYYYLWRFLAQKRGGDAQALTALRDAATKVDAGKWPYSVYELFFGKLSPADLVAKAGNADERCEATFYSAEWYLQHGDHAQAQQRFQTALSSCPTTFLEYDGAKGELGRLVSSGGPAPAMNSVQTTTDGRGRRTSQISRAPDGSSVTTAFDAATGKTLSVTRKNRAGILTGATFFDPLDAQPWLGVEQRFDAGGRKVSETQYLDAGGRADVNFAVSGARTQIKYYTAIGILAAVTDFDIANATAWREISKSFDPTGKTTSQVTLNDAGTKVQVNYDPANTQTWASHQETFNTAGQLLAIEQANDDDTQNLVTFDVANTLPWTRHEQYKDSAGRLLNQSHFYDDNTKDVVSYNVTNTATWRIYRQTYNAAGLLVQIDQTNDDSTHYTFTYDVDEEEPWTRCEQIKDSMNHTLTRSNFNDDGTRDIIRYDVANTERWASKTDHYSAAGDLLSSTQLDDKPL